MLKLITYNIGDSLHLEVSYRKISDDGGPVWSFLGRSAYHLPSTRITPEQEFDWMITLAQDLSAQLEESSDPLQR